MAKFSRIPKSQAPPPRRPGDPLAARKREYEEYVTSLKQGEVGQLTPDRGESARSVALRLNRAAKRLDRLVRVWIDAGNVYIEPLR